MNPEQKLVRNLTVSVQAWMKPIRRKETSYGLSK
jgi:hypothetical protein